MLMTSTMMVAVHINGAYKLQIHKQTDKQTDRQTDRHETNRQTDLCTKINVHIDGQTNT